MNTSQQLNLCGEVWNKFGEVPIEKIT